jgi:G3E family GTPase
VAHLLCDQIDFANVLIINKCDLLKDEEQRLLEVTLRRMNKGADIVRTSFGRVDLSRVLLCISLSLSMYTYILMYV